ncbi:MAG: hypothetical protein U5R31_05065 [Acidimicrobiia bacterium]|nr:hypothetical protein [Acidimicrobiia bacterium]
MPSPRPTRSRPSSTRRRGVGPTRPGPGSSGGCWSTGRREGARPPPRRGPARAHGRAPGSAGLYDRAQGLAGVIVADASWIVALRDPDDPHHLDAAAINDDTAVEEILLHPLTLAECLVAPARLGVLDQAAAALRAAFEVTDVDDDAPLRWAGLRARRRLCGCPTSSCSTPRSPTTAGHRHLRRATRRRGARPRPRRAGVLRPRAVHAAPRPRCHRRAVGCERFPVATFPREEAARVGRSLWAQRPGGGAAKSGKQPGCRRRSRRRFSEASTHHSDLEPLLPRSAAVTMTLSEKSRTTMYTAFTEWLGEEVAADMLSQYPLTEGDEAVTRSFLRASSPS